MFEAAAKRYQAHADECRHLAAEAASDDDRLAWLRLATEWDRLAEDARHRRGIFDRYE